MPKAPLPLPLAQAGGEQKNLHHGGADFAQTDFPGFGRVCVVQRGEGEFLWQEISQKAQKKQTQ